MKTNFEERAVYPSRLIKAFFRDIICLFGAFDDPDQDGYRSEIRKEWDHIQSRRMLLMINRELAKRFGPK